MRIYCTSPFESLTSDAPFLARDAERTGAPARYSGSVTTTFFDSLLARRAAIKDDWLKELYSNPRLAELAPRVDEALDEILKSFTPEGRLESARPVHASERSPCAENPIVQFYLAGERAVLRAAADAETGYSLLAPGVDAFDLTEVYLILRRIARKQVKRLCGGCATCRRSGHGQAHSHAHHAFPRPHSDDEDEFIAPMVNAIEPA